MDVSVKLPAKEVARSALVLLGVGVGAYLLWRVQEVIFLLIVAILLATAIEPLVNRLRRGPFTRGSGVLIVYSLIILAIGLPIYAVLPGLASQAASFAQAATDRLQELRPMAETLPRPLQGLVAEAIDSTLNSIQSPPAPPQTQQAEEHRDPTEHAAQQGAPTERDKVVA